MRYPVHILLLILVFPVRPVWAGDLTPQDFAYGFRLEISGDGAIYSLPIPDEIYRTARQADLADVRVFNAAGEAVPHVLREAGEQETDLRRRIDVPFFPLVETAEGAHAADLAVKVRRGAGGMIVSIATDATAPFADRGGRRSYLLDLSGLKTETGKLDFSWQSDNLPFTAVSIYESDDLVRWRPLVGPLSAGQLLPSWNTEVIGLSKGVLSCRHGPSDI